MKTIYFNPLGDIPTPEECDELAAGRAKACNTGPRWKSDARGISFDDGRPRSLKLDETERGMYEQAKSSGHFIIGGGWGKAACLAHWWLAGRQLPIVELDIKRTRAHVTMDLIWIADKAKQETWSNRLLVPPPTVGGRVRHWGIFTAIEDTKNPFACAEWLLSEFRALPDAGESNAAR